MSNAEGDKPDFDETLEPLSPEGVFPPDEPGETLEPLEPFGDTEPGEGPETLEPLEPVGEYAEPTEGGPEPLEPMPAVAGADSDVLEPLEEEAEEEPKKKGPGLLARLVPTPYVALLGITVLAIVIANLCLLLELGRYGGEIKPPQAGAASTAQ